MQESTDKQSLLSPSQVIFIKNDTSGAEVFLSGSDTQFSLIPEFALAAARKAAEAIYQAINDGTLYCEQTSALRKAFRKLAASGSRPEFTRHLEDIWQNILNNKARTPILTNLLVRLWSENCILWPRNIVSSSTTVLSSIIGTLNLPTSNLSLGNHHNELEKFKATLAPLSENTAPRVFIVTLRLMMIISPVLGKRHLDRDIVEAALPYAPNSGRYLNYLRKGLIEYTLMTSGADDASAIGDIVANSNILNNTKIPFDNSSISANADDYNVGNSNSALRDANLSIALRGRRSDRDFSWATEIDPTLIEWKECISTWVRGKRGKKRLHSYLQIGNHFLDYLIKSPEITRDPSTYFLANYTPPQDIKDYLLIDAGMAGNKTWPQTLGHLNDFLETALDIHCSEEVDGACYRMRGYRNPININDIPPRFISQTQTHRLAMPTRFVEITKEILVRDKFKWARKNFPKDTFSWVNPTTAFPENVWNPVRAYFVLTKLLLPLRTYQVRMLDSGEGDQDVFDLSTGLWQPNQLQTERFPKPQGALRQIWDGHKGSWLIPLVL